MNSDTTLIRPDQQEFSLRPALNDDLQFLYMLHRETMREYIDMTWGWDEQDQIERFQSKLGLRLSHMEVILTTDKRVGMVEIEPLPDVIFLRNLEILPAFQSAGLGGAVLRQVIAGACHTSKKIRLQVLRCNSRAMHLYLRTGFREAGKTINHVLMETDPS